MTMKILIPILLLLALFSVGCSSQVQAEDGDVSAPPANDPEFYNVKADCRPVDSKYSDSVVCAYYQNQQVCVTQTGRANKYTNSVGIDCFPSQERRPKLADGFAECVNVKAAYPVIAATGGSTMRNGEYLSCVLHVADHACTILQASGGGDVSCRQTRLKKDELDSESGT
jgi:hypothetical protein